MVVLRFLVEPVVLFVNVYLNSTSPSQFGGAPGDDHGAPLT